MILISHIFQWNTLNPLCITRIAMTMKMMITIPELHLFHLLCHYWLSYRYLIIFYNMSEILITRKYWWFDYLWSRKTQCGNTKKFVRSKSPEQPTTHHTRFRIEIHLMDTMNILNRVDTWNEPIEESRTLLGWVNGWKWNKENEHLFGFL